MKGKRIILIGEVDSKRTEFFLKAADRQQVTMEFYPWSEWKNKDIEGGVVKIDPPSFHEYNILSLPKRIQEYQEQLLELEEIGKKKETRFLNPPSGILQLLDKVACKETLQEHHVAVTTMVAKNVNNYVELKERMVEKRIRSVFLKPVYGSGAAGILALSIHPATGKVVAYTAACVEVLKELLPRFEALEDYSIAGIEALLMEYVAEKGIKNGVALWPVRTAVSGKQMTPGGAYEIMSILGKEESLRRIRIGIEKLSAAVA